MSVPAVASSPPPSTPLTSGTGQNGRFCPRYLTTSPIDCTPGSGFLLTVHAPPSLATRWCVTVDRKTTVMMKAGGGPGRCHTQNVPSLPSTLPPQCFVTMVAASSFEPTPPTSHPGRASLAAGAAVSKTVSETPPAPRVSSARGTGVSSGTGHHGFLAWSSLTSSGSVLTPESVLLTVHGSPAASRKTRWCVGLPRKMTERT
mmetsp:Transcript_33945/g.89072  ORF Transcript_33945/g.89072 Transcript_33945/m.89072 type:complete len:202 (+) Transcript_33945:1002-1607(+)